MIMEVFDKLNGLVDKVDLSTKPDIPAYIAQKDKVKANIAYGFIGFGKTGSSTRYYGIQFKEAGRPVNDQYLPDHIYFVSTNGDGHGLIETYEECVKALENDAILVMDSYKYLKGSKYNQGEKDLRELLLNYGAIPDEHPEYCLYALEWND